MSERRDPAAEPFDEPADVTDPPGLSDGGQLDLDDHALLVAYRLQAQLEQLRTDIEAHRQASSADRGELRRMIVQHDAIEQPKLRDITRRCNLNLALMLSVALFSLAGPDGLRRIGDFLSRDGTLGFDGMATIAGFAIPLLYPLGRRLFLHLESGRSTHG